MNKTTHSLAFALSISVALAWGPSAHACGGLVQPATGTVGLDAQRAFLSVQDGKTELVVQLQVPAAGNAYGVLLPVPGEPMIDGTPVNAGDLDALEEATRPRIVRVQAGGGGGLGCGAPADKAGDQFNGGGDVILGRKVDIGPVTAQSLSASDGTALGRWLQDNGFVLPQGAQRVVDGYAAPGKWFVAIKRNDTQAGASSVGVHLTLDGDQRGYALRMAAVGAAQSVAFLVFVAAPQAVGAAAPFRTLTLADLPSAALRGGDYRGAITEAVQASGGRAFVAEGTRPATVLPARLLALSRPGHTLTRLSSIMTAASLTEDVSFTGPAPAQIPSEIAVSGVSDTPTPPLPRSFPLRPELLLLFAGLAALLRQVARRYGAAGSAAFLPGFFRARILP